MENKNPIPLKLIIWSLTVLLVIIAFSCKTPPQDREEEIPAETVIPVEAPVIPAPVIIEEIPAVIVQEQPEVNQELYYSTRDEVQKFIGDLNNIIKSKDFRAWEAFLSPDYIAAVTSPVNLRYISDFAIMKRYNIVLKDLRDYFNYVVIPARDDDRIRSGNVDIEYISDKRVTVFISRTTEAGEQVSEILYDLEKIDNSWKIIY